MKQWLMGWVLACATPAVFAAEAALPQRNLAVELRWVTSQQRSGQDLSAGGGVVVGTNGTVDARGSVVLRAGDQRSEADQVQRVTVLNGGRAGMRLTQSLPVQWLEVATTPRGPAALLRQGLMEAGTAFELRPRWPGGPAPVTVEVAHQDSRAARGDIGSTNGGVFTTVQLPLNEWVSVAESVDQGRAMERGALSTRDVAASQRRLLQMRVSLP
ncbi:hypothetical protein [Ideonella sp. BN130291]|uniref:hypothetical protein n=1 Tax=Ideonella sp. BN130291 TaxID=3112940 RepID=UPI002E253846|nr:hypothetical protein [Ideonella sp. BN130291]